MDIMLVIFFITLFACLMVPYIHFVYVGIWKKKEKGIAWLRFKYVIKKNPAMLLVIPPVCIIAYIYFVIKLFNKQVASNFLRKMK